MSNPLVQGRQRLTVVLLRDDGQGAVAMSNHDQTPTGNRCGMMLETTSSQRVGPLPRPGGMITRQQEHFALGQMLQRELHQTYAVRTIILQRFIDARPFALKNWRTGELGE